MDYSDRTSKIEFDGKEYELLLTTKAVHDIGKRFGGLDKMDEELEKDPALAMESLCFILATLANQVIARKNRKDPQNAEKQLTTEDFLENTMLYEIIEYKDAIKECFAKGTKRNIESQEEHGIKNVQTE